MISVGRKDSEALVGSSARSSVWLSWRRVQRLWSLDTVEKLSFDICRVRLRSPWRCCWGTQMRLPSARRGVPLVSIVLWCGVERNESNECSSACSTSLDKSFGPFEQMGSRRIPGHLSQSISGLAVLSCALSDYFLFFSSTLANFLFHPFVDIAVFQEEVLFPTLFPQSSGHVIAE